MRKDCELTDRTVQFSLNVANMRPILAHLRKFISSTVFSYLMRNFHTLIELLPKNIAGSKSLASSIKKIARVKNVGLKKMKGV